jgi:hypothetical protein
MAIMSRMNLIISFSYFFDAALILAESSVTQEQSPGLQQVFWVMMAVSPVDFRVAMPKSLKSVPGRARTTTQLNVFHSSIVKAAARAPRAFLLRAPVLYDIGTRPAGT